MNENLQKIARFSPFSGVPHITIPDIYGQSPNVPFLWRISVLGERPMKITAEGLPDTLALYENVISGTVKCEGKCKFEVLLTAENALGRDTKRVSVIIEPDGALKTPLLGFTTWNAFGSGVTQKDMENTAGFLVKSGIAEYGYDYINLDSGWQGKYGGKYDAVMANEKFPDMKGMYDRIHALGLCGGIYSSPYTECCGCPADMDYLPGCTRGDADIRFAEHHGGIGLEHCEKANVRQWSEWGADWLKYDWWPTDTVNADLMKKELLRADRQISYCVTVYANEMFYGYWNKSCAAWRCNDDSDGTWENLKKRMGILDVWRGKTSVGHFYDLDMLDIGMKSEDDGGLTDSEKHFSMSLHMFFPSPIQISAKLENLSEYELSLMCNREMLRINQDSLCDYPRLLGDISSDECRIYKRTLSDGGKAFAVFNMSEKTLNTKLDFGGKYRIRDPWQSVFLGEADSYLCKTAPHSATVIRLFPL